MSDELEKLRKELSPHEWECLGKLWAQWPAELVKLAKQIESETGEEPRTWGLRKAAERAVNHKRHRAAFQKIIQDRDLDESLFIRATEPQRTAAGDLAIDEAAVRAVCFNFVAQLELRGYLKNIGRSAAVRNGHCLPESFIRYVAYKVFESHWTLDKSISGPAFLLLSEILNVGGFGLAELRGEQEAKSSDSGKDRKKPAKSAAKTKRSVAKSKGGAKAKSSGSGAGRKKSAKSAAKTKRSVAKLKGGAKAKLSSSGEGRKKPAKPAAETKRSVAKPKGGAKAKSSGKAKTAKTAGLKKLRL
jgi:hypothetical protein